MDAEVETFRELKAVLEREDYAKAVELCNKIRSKNAEDQDVIKVKCVALMRMNKFDKALQLAAKHDYLEAERAYCLYRLQQDDQAVELLPSNLEEASHAMLHVAAQVLYRRGDFDRCIEIYEHLLSTADPDDRFELHTNLLAAYAGAGRTSELHTRDIPTEHSFEVAFNKSFISIERQDWETAQAELSEAEAYAQELAKETKSMEEVALIQMQAAFVKQMKGDLDGALADYRRILKLKLSNHVIEAVASNNLVSIRKDRDVGDSLKRLNAIDNDVISSKLSPEQQEAVLLNRALLLCFANKVDDCKRVLKQLKDRFPTSRATSELLTLLAAKDPTSEEMDMLQQDTSVAGRLGLSHVYLSNSQTKEAADCLASIEEIQHTPGTVATLVALYNEAGDAASAQRVFDQALAASTSPEALMKLQEGCGAYLLEKRKYQEAAEKYAALLDGQGGSALDPDVRLRSLASLVIALSYCDASAAETRSAMLPPVDSAGTNAEDLEREARASGRLTSKLTAVSAAKNDRKRKAKNPERIARKRSKRREKYLHDLKSRPDYNPTIGLVHPDPERWVPRKERSYSKRGRRGRNRYGTSAQGAGGAASEKDARRLDAAARAAKKAEGSGPDKGVVVTSSMPQRKSKKKKRR